MIIRKIAVKDAECFLNMLKQLDAETKFMLFDRDERKTTTDDIKKKIQNSGETNSLILVAEQDGSIAGFLSAKREPYNRVRHCAYIVVGILKDYRGMGIGTQLFEQLEAWARSSGITRLELTAMTHNKTAVGLYQKMGFQIEGIRKNAMTVDGEYVDEYYMGRVLD